jgi:hypothetical protein
MQDVHAACTPVHADQPGTKLVAYALEAGTPRTHLGSPWLDRGTVGVFEFSLAPLKQGFGVDSIVPISGFLFMETAVSLAPNQFTVSPYPPTKRARSKV